jgi:hypothetical protein
LAGDKPTRSEGGLQLPWGAGRRGPILDHLTAAGLNRNLAAAALAPLIGAVVTLWLVIPTLAPGVLSWDTAEFQTVGPVLGTAHPTGYPAYVILGFIASHLLPFGDPAYRMNLLQAIMAAGAVAGVVALVQFLTGMRWVALATGLLLLIMPTWSPATVSFPDGTSLTSSPLFWRVSTHADPHLFHVALVALIFLLLLVWERRRTDADLERRRHADRWLVAAAGVFGVAVANHSLALLLPPAIGLFVIAVAPGIFRQWRLILKCAAVLAAVVVVLFLELPIRAAMHAPLVYGHPDTWSGFQYVVLAEQFRGSLSDPFGNLGLKYAEVMNLFASWLGPLGLLALVGLGTSLVKRPRYLVLAGLAAVVTCGFSAAYANADIERYFLLPLFVAFTFVGLGLADALDLCVWLVGEVGDRVAPRTIGGSPEPASAAASPALEPAAFEPTAQSAAPSAPIEPAPIGPAAIDAGWGKRALLLVEILAAVVLLSAAAPIAPDRQAVPGAIPGGVSETDQTYRETWMRAVLATPDRGGLPANAVIVSWWSDSTTLWYGQKVEGLRSDIYIVDDRTRLDDNLGEVWDVIDRFLGQRPVFLDRISGGVDGMDALSQLYVLRDFQLPDGATIKQVISKKGTK